jgi:diaminopimelate decarboxylase/DNA modification methylase
MVLSETLLRLANDDLPALVYFDCILRESVKAFLAETERLPRRTLFYSVKAAAFPFLLHALRRHGVTGFDASSPMEGAYIRSIVGFDVPIVVTAPSVTEEDVAILRSIRPARVHADSIASLNVLLPHAAELPIGLRVNPGVGDSAVASTATGTPQCRLGVPVDSLPDCLDMCEHAGVRNISLHYHIACNADSFSAHADALSRLSVVIESHGRPAPRIHCLDLGGGLRPPVWNFETDELERADRSSSVASLAKEIGRFLLRTRGLTSPDLTIWLEPGDALVCAAAVLIARVSERRTSPDGTPYVIVNTNINHFPNLMLDGEQPRLAWPPSTDEGNDSIIAGNSCLADDMLGRVHTSIPFERVAFDARGGYEFSRMTFFNGRPRPSVFFHHENGQLTCERRDTLDDLHRFWSPSDSSDHGAIHPPLSTWFVLNDGPASHYSGLKDAETSFPESLARTLIASFTRPGDIVMDPFAGFGTTAVAAAAMRRIGIGIELNPERQELASKRVRPPHRVILANCNDVQSLGIGTVDMVLTSPPHWQARGDALQAYAAPPVSYCWYLDQFAATLNRINAVVRPQGTVVLVVHNIAASGDKPAKPLAWDLGRIASEQLWFVRDWIACTPWQEIDAAEFGNHAHCLIFSKRDTT